MLVFLEFHLIDNDLIRDRQESIQYQITEITEPEYKIITRFLDDNPVAHFDYCGNEDHIITVYINKFDVIDDDKLKLYQSVFNFTGTTFNTFITRSLVLVLLSQIICEQNTNLVKEIFEYYMVYDSQFADDLKDLY